MRGRREVAVIRAVNTVIDGVYKCVDRRIHYRLTAGVGEGSVFTRVERRVIRSMGREP